MTFREFNGKNVEEAIRSAMKEFSADLSDLDIEILAQGSRGILGVGGEEARILAAPKSAVAAAKTVRAPEPRPAPEPARARTAPAISSCQTVSRQYRHPRPQYARRKFPCLQHKPDQQARWQSRRHLEPCKPPASGSTLPVPAIESTFFGVKSY